jgi:hypothetical protein
MGSRVFIAFASGDWGKIWDLHFPFFSSSLTHLQCARTQALLDRTAVSSENPRESAGSLEEIPFVQMPV